MTRDARATRRHRQGVSPAIDARPITTVVGFGPHDDLACPRPGNWLRRQRSPSVHSGWLGDAKTRLRWVALGFLGDDFEERVRRVSIRDGEGTTDPFGLDPEWAKYAMGVAVFFQRTYFRTEVHGLKHVPAGRVLLVANHSGQLPFDGMVLSATLFLDADPPRLIRSMVDTRTQTLPFVAVFFSRTGQVVGIPENARRLLERGEAIVVFPEGVRGISKSFANRYRLAELGLGFMRLALETKTPIVPVAVIGAEEQYISLGNLEHLANRLGWPCVPNHPSALAPRRTDAAADQVSNLLRRADDVSRVTRMTTTPSSLTRSCAFVPRFNR